MTVHQSWFIFAKMAIITSRLLNVAPQTNDPYSDRNPSLDLLLNSPSDRTPLCSSPMEAHSLGTLYATDLWSLVDKNRPALADLVPWPCTLDTGCIAKNAPSASTTGSNNAYACYFEPRGLKRSSFLSMEKLLDKLLIMVVVKLTSLQKMLP